MDLALNNLERLICHKTQANKQTERKNVQCMSPERSSVALHHHDFLVPSDPEW